MAHFSHSTVIPYSRDTVFSWHRRPGALTRLSPEWAQQVVDEAHPPLHPGARARIRTSLPGTHGVIRTPFESEHAAGPSEYSFIDRMVRGPLHSWQHLHTFSAAPATVPTAPTGADSNGHETERCRIDDDIDYALSLLGTGRHGLLEQALMEPTLHATFRARNDRLLADLDYQAQLAAIAGHRRLNVLVAGASGTVGSQVAALLSTGGHRVRRLVRRSPRRADEVRWNPHLGHLRPEALAWADVVIHLGGAGIGTRFTSAAKERILSSRIDSTRLLVLAMEALPPRERPETFICASAVGYYGSSRGDAALDEDAGSGNGFLARVCRQWEAEAARVEDLGVRWASIRTGIVLTSLSGVLKLQLPLYLSGLGGALGSGDQWLSWISLDDIARVYARAAVDTSLSGPINAVAPHPVRQRKFAEILGRLARRPTAVRVPGFGPALLLGKQAAAELALADQYVVPAQLSAVLHPFRYPELAPALAASAGFTLE